MFLNKETKEKVLEICDKDYIPSSNKVINKQNAINDYYHILKTKIKECDVIPTNIKNFDRMLGGGLRPGIYVFGANPGLGKTSLMLHIMIELALNKNHSLLFNLEMSLMQVQTKLLANYSYRRNLINKDNKQFTINDLYSIKKIDINNLKTKYIELIKAYNDNIYPFINIISKSEDVILKNEEKKRCCCDYVERVETAIKNYQKYYQITPVIIIDFLQLLKTEEIDEDNSKTYDKRLEMNIIIEKLKSYSNIYQVPIILISSLSRNSYTRKENEEDEIEYNLSIFKETGHIEYTADFLALLTEGKADVSFTDTQPKYININILKTRFSQNTGDKETFTFLPEYCYFENNDNA